MDIMHQIKDIVFYSFVIVLFVLGGTVLVISELGRIRREWRKEMNDEP